MNLSKVLLCLLAVLSAALLSPLLPTASSDQVTLAWDASETPDVDGYRIWWSANSGSYNIIDSTDVGDVLQATVEIPNNSYIVATCYKDGEESGVSNEIRYYLGALIGSFITAVSEDCEEPEPPPDVLFSDTMETVENHVPEVGIGIVTINGAPVLVAGVDGNAVQFQNENDGFWIDPVNVPWQGGEIEFDFMPSAEFFSFDTNYLAGGTPPDGFFRIQGNHESALFRTGLAGGTAGLAIVSWSPALGQWSHFRVRWVDGGLIELWVDGQYASGNPAAPMGGELQDFTIGNLGTNPNYCHGTIDNFIIKPLE